MGATATLSAADLSAEPGQEATCTVVVRNTGQLVDQFTVDVVGDAADWAVAEPQSVNLVPDQSAEVVVRFAPPRSAAVPAGTVHFGIRVTSREDPYGSVVEEGAIEVAPFTDVAAELLPAKVEAASRARYEVAVDNVGNHPVTVRITPSDPEDELDFDVDRPEVVLAPGTAAYVRVVARPRDRFLRGRPVRHPFRVEVLPGTGAPLTVDGTMVQRQLLPKWLLPALAALLAFALLLAVLWFTVLRPAVRSAAREAAAAQAGEVKEAAQRAEDSAGAAQADSAQAKQNSERAMEAVGLPVDGSGAPQPPRPTTTGQSAPEPTDFRVAANAAITSDTGRFTDFGYSPPDDKKGLAITDLIVQNPRGDTGTVRIIREANGTRSTLLELGLANFRDQDYHYVQPLRFKPGERFILAVSCQNPAERGNCTPAVSFSGRVEG